MKSRDHKTAQGDTHDPNARKVIAVNRRARHEYEIIDTYQAGIVLVGTEVKSLRAGRVNFQDAFVRIENNEAWLYNMHISPYEQGNRWNVEPVRRRKLLLHRWEIDELRGRSEQKGLTIVPLQLYFQRGFARIEIGLGRGKKLYDKRQAIAERDRQREQQRELSGR
ncbi:MAG: SsrA-binding protein SmpB [Chloroherpetonaceae bacterium]|nr:SsrA-binding protein SmpB [Chthonomonadaceae bacterium]MDW8208464.1 SsrA-binding protein SmpB [Chloroherpetonaceae bacterium]